MYSTSDGIGSFGICGAMGRASALHTMGWASLFWIGLKYYPETPSNFGGFRGVVIASSSSRGLPMSTGPLWAWITGLHRLPQMGLVTSANILEQAVPILTRPIFTRPVHGCRMTGCRGRRGNLDSPNKWGHVCHFSRLCIRSIQ